MVSYGTRRALTISDSRVRRRRTVIAESIFAWCIIHSDTLWDKGVPGLEVLFNRQELGFVVGEIEHGGPVAVVGAAAVLE
jgi:hypothetical protein